MKFQNPTHNFVINSVLRILITYCMLLSAFPACGNFSHETKSYSIPWNIVAENINKGSRFCSNTEHDKENNLLVYDASISSLCPKENYIFQDIHSLIIKLPERTTNIGSSLKIKINIHKHIEDSWLDFGTTDAIVGPNETRIPLKTGEEGFFRLKLTVVQNSNTNYLEAYFLVCNNWKKDILAFCREMKQEIEYNPDEKLVFSSIAVSHFDHTMEIVSRSSFLSGKALKALSDAVKGKKDFEAGLCPDMVIGLNKLRLKRFEGAKITEFVVYVPKNYNSSRKWPILLYPDPHRFYADHKYSRRSGSIDIWWHFPRPMGYDWKDYKYFLSILKSKLNVDINKIHIYGLCGDGPAAMSMALHYPDEWAGINIDIGNSYNNLAGNAFNLNMNFFKVGHYGEDYTDAYYDSAVKCFEYHRCRHFDKSKKSLPDIYATLNIFTKEPNPTRVFFTIDSLHTTKAYWVKVNSREDENLVGSIDAVVDGQIIRIDTDNVDAYSLDLRQAPVDSNKPITIFENGQSLGLTSGPIFTKKSGRYDKAKYLKNNRLSGPVSDIFTDQYVVVYGTGSKDKKFSQISKKIAHLLSGNGPCFTDTDMSKELVDSHNLILVGTEESNLWIAKVYKDLPVQIKGDRLIANGKVYVKRDIGFILIHPNPINSARYVAVFSATSSRAMSNVFKAYLQMKSKQPADIGIFEVSQEGNIKWHVMEKLNAAWGWHSKWDQLLAVTNHKHPKWKWHQWVAKALREQLESDIAICDDFLNFPDLPSSGQITYRDLFNHFRNDWIMKISLNGKSLRNTLLESFNDTSKENLYKLAIDGLSLVKQEQNISGKTLLVEELKDNKRYTMVLSYNLVKGLEAIMGSKDYKIIGEGYVVPALKSYLCKNKNLDIDVQLDNLRPSMF